MITKSIYSYRVRIKYGVYTRTIIGVSSLQSLSAPSQRDAESKLGRRILPLGFPSGTGYRGRGDALANAQSLPAAWCELCSVANGMLR